MKTLLSKFSFFSILTLVSFLFISFTQGVVWLDENHNQVTQENGIFYRPIPEKKRSIYLIVDYYKNGAKYREGKAASFAVKKYLRTSNGAEIGCFFSIRLVKP